MRRNSTVDWIAFDSDVLTPSIACSSLHVVNLPDADVVVRFANCRCGNSRRRQRTVLMAHCWKPAADPDAVSRVLSYRQAIVTGSCRCTAIVHGSLTVIIRYEPSDTWHAVQHTFTHSFTITLTIHYSYYSPLRFVGLTILTLIIIQIHYINNLVCKVFASNAECEIKTPHLN